MGTLHCEHNLEFRIFRFPKYLSDFVETNFFNTTLRRFIENNIPNEEDRVGGKTEDSVIDMIFHYYSTTTLLHARITPLHSPMK